MSQRVNKLPANCGEEKSLLTSSKPFIRDTTPKEIEYFLKRAGYSNKKELE